MPIFNQVPLQETVMKFAPAKRTQILKPYLGYIEQLTKGHAGRLQVSAGETVGAVRRRIGAASKLAGKDLVIKRVGSEVYFWEQKGSGSKGKRGRPRKVT